MNARVKRILDEVRELPPSEKRLVREWLEDEDEDTEVSKAWASELERRARESRAGLSTTSSVEEHLARLEARLLK